VEEDPVDEQAWDNWLVESDSDSSAESEWINLESDGSDNLKISDSDSEIVEDEPGPAKSDQHKQPPARVSSFATTKVGNVPRVP
jgi:hypothetical protein